MKRKLRASMALLLALAALLALPALAGCDDEGGPTGTGLLSVSFLQTGEPTIVRRVAKGEALTDIPTPQPRTGYIVTWDRTDFSHVETDLVVRAVETPACTVTYQLGTHADATITAVTQVVPIGEAVTLYKPSFKGDPFSYWEVTVGGPVEEGSVSMDEAGTQGILPYKIKYAADGKKIGTEPSEMRVILAGDVTLTAKWQSDVDPEGAWTGRH